MRIAVIGAGNVGAALGQGWRVAGHDVIFGVRDVGKARPELAGASVVAMPEAVAQAEVVVLATPWTTVPDALRQMGDLAGKILVDCTNPLGMGPEGLHLTVGHTDSGAEAVHRLAPQARLVKGFNTTGFENMRHARDFAFAPAMFLASDDPAARQAVSVLARDLGFEPVDAGPLKNARLLEPLAMLWIDQAFKRSSTRDFALALVRRGTAAP